MGFSSQTPADGCEATHTAPLVSPSVQPSSATLGWPWQLSAPTSTTEVPGPNPLIWILRSPFSVDPPSPPPTAALLPHGAPLRQQNSQDTHCLVQSFKATKNKSIHEKKRGERQTDLEGHAGSESWRAGLSPVLMYGYIIRGLGSQTHDPSQGPLCTPRTATPFSITYN